MKRAVSRILCAVAIAIAACATVTLAGAVILIVASHIDALIASVPF